MKNTLSAIDLYNNRVFKILMILLPMSAVSAGGTLLLIKSLGYYQDLPWPGLIIFCLSTLVYITFGILFVINCEDKNGKLKPGILRSGKLFLLAVAAIQWNFLSYLLPSRDFWAYAIFFCMLSAFFLSSRLVLVCIGIIIPSLIISWIVRGPVLLPVLDAIFMPEMILRIVLLTLGCFTIWLLTFFIERFLVPELEHAAEYDTLTMLHTRRTLEETAGKLINQCFRSGESFTLLMCDLDDFKSINDTYGHDCGDDVLRFVSDTVQKNLGDSDMAFRYGGEELLIIMDADEKTALSRAESIRRDVENGMITRGENIITITVTIGAYSYKQYDTLDTMIKTADEYMYYGKRNGKNQVVSSINN